VLSAAFNSLTGRDQYEAVTELEQLETNLEAAYLVTTRLSNLTLLNFIR
jgi:flagellar hook-associated protein 3 FlgL